VRIYFAPMEGITDAVYRRVHYRNFGGAQKYFMPFISPSHSLCFNRRERFDMSPEQNSGVPAVPQILTNKPEYFQAVSALLRDMGYSEVNLNLGCPSGTVTAKGKGSGLLRTPDVLEKFLDAIFARPVLPISIKTRIGYDSLSEWPALYALLRAYPYSELIVHPRTRQEFYQGEPHREACSRIDVPYIYNGNLFRKEDCLQICNESPAIQGVMLGRGLVANPALAREANGGAPLMLEELRSFHDDMFSEYLHYWPESAVVGRMHLIMKYMSSCFENSEKARRAIVKATNAEEYHAAVYQLFHNCPFREKPAFILENILKQGEIAQDKN